MADSFDAQKTYLLVIDDDKKLCRLIKDYLEPLGYDVAAASTGKESLDKALAGKFDAVILDIMMPEMDGLEVLRRLRASLSVPVLMLTGLGEESDRIVGLEMGADDYLPKTFSTRELLARLRAVIRRSRLTAAKSDPSAGNEDAPVVVGNLHLTGTEARNGFVFIAYPAEYRSSGVMTLVVTKRGVVYEKDLGANTSVIAGSMTAFHKDASWRPAGE